VLERSKTTATSSAPSTKATVTAVINDATQKALTVSMKRCANFALLRYRDLKPNRTNLDAVCR